jgi:hypothetical protein
MARDSRGKKKLTWNVLIPTTIKQYGVPGLYIGRRKMIAKGIENADSIIESCRLIIAGVDSQEPEGKEVLQSGIDILEDMKKKFFLKTNLAIPPTNACKKDAIELQSIVEGGDLSRFPELIDRFRGNMEKLLKHAKMEGVIIT